MDRYRYIMPAESHTAGHMGRLQTLAVVPVCAGDSVKITWNGAVRLAPLKRYMSSDPRYDMFWFYVPHRHAYGKDWIDFIQEGINEAVTFGGVAATNIAYLGMPLFTGTIPTWLVHAYNATWNRYFRIPTDDASIRADTFLETTANGKEFGALCARLKNIWTTGVDAEIASTTREVAVSGGVFDVIDLAQTRRNLKTEVDRQWFGQYYNDILGTAFGGSSNADADERPTLLMRKTQFMSGFDVDGTGDASLGTYTGKSINGISCMVPRKFCPEHGVIVGFGLMRFPAVHQNERHMLMGIPEPSYLDISGDQALYQAEPPIELNGNQVFNGSGSVNLGTIPYGQHYRYQPSYVHSRFTGVSAFPFLSSLPTSVNQARYYQDNEYGIVFQTTQLGHWQHHASYEVEKSTIVPGPKSSMYAGVNDV